MVLTDFGLSWYCWVTYMHSEFQPRHLINKPCKLHSTQQKTKYWVNQPTLSKWRKKNSFLWVQKILSCCEPQWFFVQLHFERDFSHLWTRVDTDFVLKKKFIHSFIHSSHFFHIFLQSVISTIPLKFPLALVMFYHVIYSDNKVDFSLQKISLLEEEKEILLEAFDEPEVASQVR